ncbi:hypothetical protein ACO0QE_000678 [Hanseniaspora vineae]
MSQQQEENEDINFTQLVENLFLQSNLDSEQDNAAEQTLQNENNSEKSTKTRKNRQDGHEGSDGQNAEYPSISDLADGALSNLPSAAASQSLAASVSNTGSRRSSLLMPQQTTNARRRRSSAYNDYLTQSLQNLMSQQRRASQNRGTQPLQRTDSNDPNNTGTNFSRRGSLVQDQDWAQLLTQGVFPETDQGHGSRKPSVNLFGRADEEHFRNAIMMSLQSMEQDTGNNDQAIIDDDDDEQWCGDNRSHAFKKPSKKPAQNSALSQPYSLSTFPANVPDSASQKRARKPRKTKASKNESVLTSQSAADQDAQHLNLVESALDDLLTEGVSDKNILPATTKNASATAGKITDKMSTVDLNESLNTFKRPATTGNKKQTKPPKLTSRLNDDNSMFSKELADIINSVVESTFQNFNKQISTEEEEEENKKDQNRVHEPEPSQPSSPDIIEIDMVGKRSPNVLRSTQPSRTDKARSTVQPIEKSTTLPHTSRDAEDEIDMFKVMQDAMALASKSATDEVLTEVAPKLSKKDKKAKSKSKSKKSKEKLSKKERRAKKNLAADREIDLGVNIDEILDSTLTTKEKEASRRKKSHKRLLSTAPMLPMSSFTTRFPTTYRKALLSTDNTKSHTPGPLSKSVQLSYQPVSELSQYFRPSSERFLPPAHKATVNKTEQSKTKIQKEKEKLAKDTEKTVITERAIENHPDDQAFMDDVVEPIVVESEEPVPGLDPALGAETPIESKRSKTRPQKAQTLEELQIKLKKKYANCAKQVAKICHEKYVKKWKQETKLAAASQKAEKKRRSLMKKEAKRLALEEKQKDIEELTKIVERGPPYPSFLRLKKNGEPKRPYRRLTAEEIARKEELNRLYFTDEHGKHIDHSYQATPERISTMAPEKKERLDRLKSFQHKFGLQGLRYSKVNILYDSSIVTPVQREKIPFHPPWMLPLHPPLSLPSVPAYLKSEKNAKKVAHAREKSKRAQEKSEKRSLEAEKKKLRKQYKRLEKKHRKEQKKKETKATLLQKRMTASAANAISSLLPLLSQIPPQNIAIINSLKALIAARAAVAIAKTKNDKKVVAKQVAYIIQQARVNITKALSESPSTTGSNSSKPIVLIEPDVTENKSGLENREITVISDDSDAEKDKNNDESKNVQMIEAKIEPDGGLKEMQSDVIPQKIIVKTEVDKDKSLAALSNTPGSASDPNLKHLVGDIFTKIASPLGVEGVFPIVKEESPSSEQTTKIKKRTYKKKKPDLVINMPDIPQSFIEQQKKAKLAQEAKRLALEKSNSPNRDNNFKAVKTPQPGVAKIENQGAVENVISDTAKPVIVDAELQDIESARISAAEKKKIKKVEKLPKPKVTPEERLKRRLEAREEIVKQKFTRFKFVIPERHSHAKYTSMMKRIQGKLSSTEFEMFRKEVFNERKRRWRIYKTVKEELNEAPFEVPDKNVTNIGDGELLNLVVFLFNKQSVVDSILIDIHKANEEGVQLEQMQKEEKLLKKKIKLEKRLEKMKPGPKKPRKPGSGRKLASKGKRTLGNDENATGTPQPKRIKLENIDGAFFNTTDSSEVPNTNSPMSEKVDKTAQHFEKDYDIEIIGEFSAATKDNSKFQKNSESTKRLSSDEADDFCGTLEATPADDCLYDTSKLTVIKESKNDATQGTVDFNVSNELQSSSNVSGHDVQTEKSKESDQPKPSASPTKTSHKLGADHTGIGPDPTTTKPDNNSLPSQHETQTSLSNATQSNPDKEINIQSPKKIAQPDPSVNSD